LKNQSGGRVRKPIPSLFFLLVLLSSPFVVLPSLSTTAQAIPGTTNPISSATFQTDANPEQSTGSIQSACLAPSASNLSTETISPSAGTTSLLGQIPPPVTAGTALPAYTVPETLQLNMELTFNMRNAASFQQCLDAINDPSSPNYHDFLTNATLEPYLPTSGGLSRG
jgi:hypothetical protein